MAEEITYYNEEYPALDFQYREAEARAAELNNPNTTPSPSTSSGNENTEPLTTRRKRNKRISRYDEELYALPDVEEGESSPPPTAPTSSKELMVWKCVGIASSLTLLLGIIAAVTGFVYISPATQGKCILQYFPLLLC